MLKWRGDCAQPTLVLPPDSVDCHCHVLGPESRFPYAPERRYTPHDASSAQLFALRDKLGVSRSVVVQATCHGFDNSAMISAVRSAGSSARGVAILRSTVTDAQLHRLHNVGVRGIRFNFLRRLADPASAGELRQLADKIAGLGWHIVVSLQAGDLQNLLDFVSRGSPPIVIDHMGLPDITQGISSPHFCGLLRLIDDSNMWVKLSAPERVTRSGPPAIDGEQRPYTDVVPFQRKLIDEFEDRVLWGTDWPHLNLTNHMPEDGLLVDHILNLAASKDQQHKLLVVNPMRLYWPEELPG